MNEPRQWPDPTQPSAGYPPGTDPAYSGPYTGQYWPPAYGSYGGYGTPPTQPTEQLPPYWQPGTGYPPGAPPPPPQPPKSPRWLWLAAGGAVVLVAGLVLALVVVMTSSKESTVVAPQTPRTTSAPPTTTPRQTAPTVPTIILPAPTTIAPAPGAEETEIPGLPGQPTEIPAGAETVVYSVTGEGRAINITYVDTGGVMQTEFNVALPWSKEVSLAPPAKNSASVAVVNVGRDVTCSVSVNGAQVRQRSGRGLTICSGLG